MPTVQDEIRLDIYNLTKLVKPGHEWYDAGYHEGHVAHQIETLGGIITGIADTRLDSHTIALKRNPSATRHVRFDPVQMIADCPTIDAAKIDIQGSELHLLNLTPAIWSILPETIVMEWHNEHLGLDAHAMTDILRHNGYRTDATKWTDALDNKNTTIITATR